MRAGRAQLKEAYVYLRGGEAFLIGAHLSPLPAASTHVTPDPVRTRKLLLNHSELQGLIGAVERGFERLREQVAAATPEQLDAPSPNERTREQLPTVKEGIVLLLTGHLGSHLGQLSMWRRMIGLPPLF